MTTPVSPALPGELADALEPELAAVADEILAAIAAEVPEYARPFEGAFGHAVRTGVARALSRFVAMLRDPEAIDERSRRVYATLGREEYRAGRTLDALQSAYRVGARVAWRSFARAGEAAGLEPPVISRLAEAIFAYLEEISAESVEGYAQAQSERAGERERARGALVSALLGHGATPGELRALAASARWQPPRRAAALACPLEELALVASRLEPGVLHAGFEGLGCAILPDVHGPGRSAALAGALAERRAALGPEVPVEQLPRSWRLAAATLALGGEGLRAADEALVQVMLDAGADAVERMAERRLGSLSELTPAGRERMLATALAYVQHQGNAPAMARALHVHPQTARHRIARLRELLGPQLSDPQARFELEAALRHRSGAS